MSNSSIPQIPSKMRGLQILSFASNEQEEKTPYSLSNDIPVPQVGENDVLIKVYTAGYCHTEMVVRGEFKSKMHQSLPIIPSHEPTGIVVALGSKAASRAAPGESNPFKVGDRVGALAFNHPCGSCSDCKLSKPIYCENQGMTGVTSNGAFAEYQLADVSFVFRLPDDLGFDQAAPLCCAGATIYSAIKQCELKKGEKLIIVGAGALGHLGVQLARCLGFEVGVVDSRDSPLEMCKALPHPPHHILNSSSTDLKDPSSIKKAIEAVGGQADAIIIATDVIPAFDLALQLTKKHGTFMVVGQPQKPINIPFDQLIFRNLTIKGSLLGDAKIAKELVDLVSEKGVEVKTQAYPLEKVHEMMAAYGSPTHSGKMVVRVHE